MNRDEVRSALRAQPFDTDVQVNVGGFLLDVARISFDTRRHAIVLDLFADDTEQAMTHFFRIGPLDAGTGNTY